MRATFAALALACGAVLLGTAASADEKAECLAAHGDAQMLRNASHLRGASAKLHECAAPTCPPLVSKDCTQWLVEIGQQQPSLVIAAKDEHGVDLVAVQASIDGQVVATRLDGTPIEVDPGEHELRCRLSDGREATQRIVARESERARLIGVAFPPALSVVARESSVPAPHRAVPLTSWVLGGLGLASAVPWAVFGISGWTEKGNLDSTCGVKGACTASQIDVVRRDFLVADITGGVSIAAATAAVLVAIFARPRPGSISIGVTPTARALLVRGQF
jgi:hypothetical protein